MDITIESADGVPIYQQIVRQIRYAVASGLLEPDDELPTIRALALKLKVTPNTVVKAYEELQRVGVVHKRHGSGTFVSGERTRIADRERRRILEQRIDALLVESHQLGFSLEELLKLLHRRRALMLSRKTHGEAGSAG